ncbi:hypothetical protein [Amycolatopsis minnesotensis]|uniref:Uncharacterized protein n=1 Tax=Amycolatopsis minnesotensis TaxID=337894 RepID=A0ABN2QR78_9PSEU
MNIPGDGEVVAVRIVLAPEELAFLAGQLAIGGLTPSTCAR